MPDRSTFSKNRLGRFRNIDLLRHVFERLRLRVLSGARDEFHVAAIVQNPKTLTLQLVRPLPRGQVAFVA